LRLVTSTNGMLMGVGIKSDAPQPARRAAIARAVKRRQVATSPLPAPRLCHRTRHVLSLRWRLEMWTISRHLENKKELLHPARVPCRSGTGLQTAAE
jgi:anthranilate phosphoribosyltransferase